MKILSNKFFLLGNLVLLLIAVPVTLFFIKQQQDNRSSAAPSSKLTFEPASPQTSTQCSNFTVDMMVDPGTNLVSIVDFYLTYDATKLDVTQITPAGNFTTVVREASLTSGQANMSVSVGADVTKAVSTVSKVVTITFVPKSAGTAQIQFDQAKTRVFSLGPADQPTENVLSSATPATVTIGTAACLNPPAGSGTPTASVPPGTTVTPSGGAVQPTGSTGTSPTPSTSATNTVPVCSQLSASPAATGSAPFSVLFTGAGNDPDTAGLINKATFTFGDGQTQDVTTGLNLKSVSVQTNHTYQSAGTFPATVVFTDNQNGVSNACTQNITVTTASGSAGTTTTPAPTTPPAATATPVPPVATATPIPTIPPTGNLAQTIGTISVIIVSLVGGFILLAL